MKKTFSIFVLLIWSLMAMSQTYNPSLGTVSNKPYAPAQGFPTDSRSFFYDATNFLWRPYQNVNEVWSYLNLAKYRVGNFIVVIDSGGTLQSNGTYINGHNTFWMFKDSTGNSNLVEMSLFGTSGACAGCLLASNNLNDLISAPAARTNLGLGAMATQGVNAGGDLSGVWPSPTVSFFNGLPPSYYLAYSHLTGTPPGISLTTSGTSGAATYNSGTGILNIPVYTTSGGGACLNCNADSIGGVPVDLVDSLHNNYCLIIDTINNKIKLAACGSGGGGSGTVTSVAMTVPTSLLAISGTPITTSGTLGLTLANASSNTVWGNGTGSTGAPGYYAPTSTNLNTWFGGTIQGQLTLTTTGTSGAATLIGTTLNIPQYTGGGTPANPTGTVGLTAVNGSATTYMRSDAAPPLSQAIVPTWTGLHTFNGGLALGSNVTFATDNTYSIGTSSVGANTINTRFVSSPGILSLQTAGSNPIVFGPNSTTKMSLAVNGQLQLSAYTTSTSFTGTPLAFIQTDASGNLIQTPLSGVQTALSGTGYVKFSGTTPSYLTPTQVTADLNVFTSSLQGLVPSSGGGTTNYLRADGTWAAPSGGGGSLPTGISPLYLQATGTSTYQFADPRQLDTLYIVDDGQSNDYGNADAGYIGDTLSDSRVQVADTVTGGWKVAHAGFYPFNIQSPTQYSLSHSFYFARKLAREQGKIVRLIHNGHNGQTISAWFTTTSQSLLDTLVQRINRFVPSGYRIVLFDWDQGESDNSTVFGTYNIAWDSVKANLHRRCPSFALSTMIAVVGMPQVALGAPTGYQGQDPNLQTRDYNLDVRDAYINTDSAYINTTSASNPVHFNADGLKYIGVSAIYNFYQGLALYYTRNNPGTLAGAPITPGRITVRYTEAPGGGAYYDAVNAMNRSATGRTGVHLLSSDSTSTVGYFGLAGPSGSYIAANQVVLFSETNSDLLLGRNFVTYIDLTSAGVTMPQKLLYTASTEASFTNTTAASGAGFTFTGDASNFVNLQLGNSGSTIANSFNIYVNNGYKALLQPTGTIIMDSAVYSGGVARSTLDIRGSSSYRIDSFGVNTNATLGNHQNVALFKTGATNDTCYLPNATTGVYRRYVIKKTDTGSVGNVVIIPFTNQSIDKALGNYLLTQTNSTITIESDGLSTWYKLGSSSASGSTPTLQQVFTAGTTLTGTNAVTNTGQIFTWTNGGTGVWKWSGLSQDTTNTMGVQVAGNDSSERRIPWAKFALKLADYLPTYNIFAANGLTAAGGDSIYLGGALNQNTTIGLGTNTLNITGSGGGIINFFASLDYNYTAATDANYTVTEGAPVYYLPNTSANRTITLPTATTSGRIIIFYNTNTSFTWSFASTVNYAGGGTLTTLSPNTWYTIMSVAGAWVVMGTYAKSGPISYGHTIFTPTTGGTVSLINNQYNIINPAGALLAVTLNLPSSPQNNDVVYIKFTQTVSTVTYANGTVVDGITAPTAGGLVVLTYDSGTTSWY